MWRAKFCHRVSATSWAFTDTHSNPDLNEYMLDRYLLNPYFLTRPIDSKSKEYHSNSDPHKKKFQIVLGSEDDPFFTFLTYNGIFEMQIFLNFCFVDWFIASMSSEPLLFSQCSSSFSTRPACLLVFLSFWKYLFFLEIAPPSSPRHGKKRKEDP